MTHAEVFYSLHSMIRLMYNLKCSTNKLMKALVVGISLFIIMA